MPRKNIPKIFGKWSQLFDQWSIKLKKNNLSATEVCLLYPLSLKEISRVVVGVDNVLQLDDIVKKSKFDQSEIDWNFMISKDQMLINPTNWKKL